MANGKSQDIISRGDSDHLWGQAQVRLAHTRCTAAWPCSARPCFWQLLVRVLASVLWGNVTQSFPVSVADNKVGRFNELKIDLYSDLKGLTSKNNN